MTKSTIQVLGRDWIPTMITGDSDELAARGERCMVRFSRYAEPEFFVAPAGMLYAGWVLGVQS